MRVEDFKQVIAEWLHQGVPEVRDREITLPLDSNLIIAVTGGRRSGKTYLLFLTIKKIVESGKANLDEILYVDFEHIRLKGVNVSDLDDMLVAFYELTGKKPKHIFLDEVQVVKGYGAWFRRRLDARIYISGSSSTLTPKNIAEELRGRCLSYEIYPLSFREYLSFVGYSPKTEILLYSEERGKILSLLRDYLYYGAYPAIVFEDDKKRLLRSYYESVLVRDLGGTSLAEAFTSYVIANYAQPITVNRVYSFLRSLGFAIGKERVIDLFNRARETYFAFMVEIFQKSERKRKMYPKKLYIIDTGYPTALGYEFSISKAMENAVYLELLRRGVGEIHYWREYGKSDGVEVDFVLSRNFEAEELIQVTYAEDTVKGREVKALKKAQRELKPKKATILTWNYRGKVDDIEAVPLWYWLLT
ncbi:MAG: ATP-binding protein [Nitrososphaeria archaeon]|nr:ATP-binding protein [Nitrososphaeria archaeon]